MTTPPTPKPQADEPRTQKWIDDNWNKLGTAEENPRAALGEPVTEYDGSTWVDYDKALKLCRRLTARLDQLAVLLTVEQAQVAELQHQLDAAHEEIARGTARYEAAIEEQWTPVEDGYMHKHQLSTGRVLSWVQVVGAIIKTSDTIHLTATELPDDVRLCRRATAPRAASPGINDDDMAAERELYLAKLREQRPSAQDGAVAP